MNNMNGAPTIEQYNGQSINPEVRTSIVAENQISPAEVATNEGDNNSNVAVEPSQSINNEIGDVNKDVVEVPASEEKKPSTGYKFARNSLFEIAVSDKANGVNLPSTAA